MKSKTTLIGLGLLLDSSAAFAAGPDFDTTVTVKGSNVNHPAYLSPNEAREIIGHYALDNGKVLVMTQKQNRYYVEISGKEAVQVIPSSVDAFAARDQSIQLQFKPAADGYTTQVTATYQTK